jgi:hypothetical protein
VDEIFVKNIGKTIKLLKKTPDPARLAIRATSSGQALLQVLRLIKLKNFRGATKIIKTNEKHKK